MHTLHAVLHRDDIEAVRRKEFLHNVLKLRVILQKQDFAFIHRWDRGCEAVGNIERCGGVVVFLHIHWKI